MFKAYESKPVIRMAYQIKELDIIDVAEKASTYIIYSGGHQVSFKAYEQPMIGDWVVRLTDTDTYHVTNAVFRERNIVS